MDTFLHSSTTASSSTVEQKKQRHENIQKYRFNMYGFTSVTLPNEEEAEWAAHCKSREAGYFSNVGPL